MAGTIRMVVAVALVATLVAVAAVSGAEAGGRRIVCRVDLDRLERACGSYCAPGSREAVPAGQCCDAVRGADFPCLCSFKGVIGSMRNINAGRAMQIPSKCRIPGAPRTC